MQASARVWRRTTKITSSVSRSSRRLTRVSCKDTAASTRRAFQTFLFLDRTDDLNEAAGPQRPPHKSNKSQQRTIYESSDFLRATGVFRTFASPRYVDRTCDIPAGIGPDREHSFARW